MVRIDDVAKAAGVSISTVSYALSGKRPVSEETKRRIDEVIRELEYRPNAGAAMLASRHTNIFALTEPMRRDTHAPTHMAFVLAASIAARRKNYDILLLTDEEAIAGMNRVAASGLADAILVLDVAPDDERAALARSVRVPTVFIGLPADPTGLICVDLDFEAAAALAVEQLTAAGHRHLGLIGQTESTYRHSHFARRLRSGFETRAAETGATSHFATSGPDRTDARSIRTAVADLIADGVTALAIHASDDVHDIVLATVAESGLDVPHDVSVVSVGNVADSGATSARIDHVPLIPQQSCDQAVDLALGCLGDNPPSPGVRLIPPTYERRGSVAPAPAPRETAASSTTG